MDTGAGGMSWAVGRGGACWAAGGHLGSGRHRCWHLWRKQMKYEGFDVMTFLDEQLGTPKSRHLTMALR